MTAPPITRGLRLNNPLNLDFVASEPPWQGEIRPPSDDRFCQFETMVYGVRANAKQILADIRHHGMTTYRGVVSEWAPPIENDTSAYLTDVCAWCAVQPDDVIDLSAPGPLQVLIRAMSIQENGRAESLFYLSDADIQAGVNAAFSASS